MTGRNDPAADVAVPALPDGPDAVDVAAANRAAALLQEVYPCADIGLMRTVDADAWLGPYADQMRRVLRIISAPRRPGRVWVDVQRADGVWRGQWVEDCPTEAAVSVAYWDHHPILAAGVGARAAADRTARAGAGDLLALLGEDW